MSISIKNLDSWFSGETTVKAKIKSIYKNSKKNKFMKCTLQDNEGNMIEMLFWDALFDKFTNKLSINKHYQFKQFTIEPAHEIFNKTKHQFQMNATMSTKINPLSSCYILQSNSKQMTCVYPAKAKKTNKPQQSNEKKEYYGIKSKQKQITQFFGPLQ